MTNVDDTKAVYSEEIAELLRPVLICCWHKMLLPCSKLWALSKLRDDAQIEAFWSAHLAHALTLNRAISAGYKLEQSYRYAGMELVTASDRDYPPMLKPSAQISPVLAVKGDIGVLSKPQAAMVGSRETHAQTPQIISCIANALHAQGLIITSGGALGTDAMAHREAMNAGKPTVVVAGTGADIVYPAKNRDIFAYAAVHGAIVSPFPSGAPGLKFNFPTRNAIIAGLSEAVVVVQCRMRSGALYTADYARKMGRPVLVPFMPGFSELTEGSLELARTGKAQWLTSVSDLERILGGCSNHAQPELPLGGGDCPPQNTGGYCGRDGRQKGVSDGEKVGESGGNLQTNKCAAIDLGQDLTDLGAAIVKILSDSPLTRECLRHKIVESGMEPVDFDETLLDLELAGCVLQCAGQYGIAGN